MRLTRWFVLALGFILLASFSQAQDESLALDAEARQLESLLIAPCCWRQPISDHQSAIAGEMKQEIRKMLNEGKSREEILAHYVETYGVRILADPPQQGFNRMSYLMPIFFVVFGVVVVGALLQKWRHQTVETKSHRQEVETGTSAGDGLVGEEMSRRIQQELDEMDA